MATVTHEVATPSTLNVTSYASGSFTPAAGDLLVAFVRAGATAATGTMTDSQGLGFTKVGHAVFSASANRVYCFVADTLAAATSMTVTFDCSADAADGAVIFVAAVSGMTRTGLSAIRQSDATDNGAAAGTPSATFPAACLTGNPTLGCVGNAANPATLTPPGSWTEPAGGDTGYATPTSGAEYVFRNSGFTGTTITWGATSGTAFGVFAVELDTSTLHSASASGASTSGGSADATIVPPGGPPAYGTMGAHTAGSSASVSFAVPSGVAADDIIVIPMFIDSITVTITAMPSGFAHAENSPVVLPAGPGAQTSLAVVWKRATGADGGTYDFTLSGSTYRAGAAHRYTNCVSSGSPWDSPTDTAVDTTNGTVTPAVDVTTAGADRMLVFAATNWAGGAWTPPTGFTERMDAGDQVHTLADKTQAAAGNSGSVTATCVGSNKRSAWLGALVGPAAGGGTTHSADASGASASTGSAAVTLQLAASASGASTSTGTAAVRVTLAATASGASTSTGSAAAAIVPPGPVTHQAAASGASTSTGSAAVTLRLTASASGASTSTGSAAITMRLTAAAAGSSVSGGTADAGRLLAALASGASTSAGSALAVILGDVVERPFTGTTARPNTGTVTRPNTGTTARPSSGTVARPNTGVILRP